MGEVGTHFDGFAHQTHGESMYNCFKASETGRRSGFTRQLGAKQVDEFALVVQPLKLQGGTGSRWRRSRLVAKGPCFPRFRARRAPAVHPNIPANALVAIRLEWCCCKYRGLT
jgi:hypothetical protein